ncbi:MAG: hypothetical protein AB1512_22060 [Thermodesulfobacteriota bacterium]
MTSRIEDIIRDPLFQLNVLLWLAQPQHPWAQPEIDPLFFEVGFTVHAIAPLLAPPPDLLLACRQRGIGVQDRVRPDVVLVGQQGKQFAFVECKANSFGVASSTANQARTLLLLAGPRSAEVLGFAAGRTLDSIPGLFLPEEHRFPMAQTLDQLNASLISQGLPAGDFSVVGLGADEERIYLQLDKKGAEFFSLLPGPLELMRLEADTDPRPLYFIPFDPDLDQTPDEKAFCKRVLLERLQGGLIALVGRAHPPFNLSVNLQRLLNDATFGTFDQWENQDTHKHLRGLAKQLLTAIAQEISRIIPGVVSYTPAEGWRIKAENPELHQHLMDGLTRFSCDSMSLETDPQLDLFEQMEAQPVSDE